MQNISQQTLANIVSSNHLAAPILERYHLDYCCKGKRSLADACNEKGIKLVDVIQDLLVEADEKKDNLSVFLGNER
jgi:regulator of cell morphogenesis and NO signaling